MIPNPIQLANPLATIVARTSPQGIIVQHVTGEGTSRRVDVIHLGEGGEGRRAAEELIDQLEEAVMSEFQRVPN